MTQLIIEAVVVGLLLGIIGVFFTKQLKDYSTFSIFFISGALTHFAFELMGANKWYCKNGNACLK